MNEKIFTTAFNRSIRRYLIDIKKTKNFVLHKISDESRDQKPADVVFFYDYKWWLLEYKIHKKSTAFAFDKVETHQIDNLDRAKRSWNHWYLIINVNIWRKKWENFTCIFDIRTWQEILKESEKKSIKLDKMKEECNFCIEKEGGLWNVKEWLG